MAKKRKKKPARGGKATDRRPAKTAARRPAKATTRKPAKATTRKPAKASRGARSVPTEGKLGKMAGAAALVLLVGAVVALWASAPGSGSRAQDHDGAGARTDEGPRSGHEATGEGAVEDRTQHAFGVTVPEALRPRVLASHPHETDAFTQGLLWHDGHLYESTGLEGESTLRQVALETGEVERYIDLPDDIFAEGLARVGDTLWQITWQNHVAYRYRLVDFHRLREVRYEGEGWGLCYDGRRLIMSDGSDRLTFRDPESFEATGQVHVTKLGRPLRRLNELLCHQGSVYANVWMTDEIVRIDPGTGQVTATVDASDIYPHEQRERDHANVLNGIAWLPDSGRFLLTGKLWPQTFEVEFVASE